MVTAVSFRVVAGGIFEQLHKMGGQGRGGGDNAVLIGKRLQDCGGWKISANGLHGRHDSKVVNTKALGHIYERSSARERGNAAPRSLAEMTFHLYQPSILCHKPKQHTDFKITNLHVYAAFFPKCHALARLSQMQLFHPNGLSLSACISCESKARLAMNS